MVTQADVYSVAELVPHAGRMILIDDILSYDDTMLTVTLTLCHKSLFLNTDDQVPAWVGIEYMAQTIAAWAGIQAKRRGEPVRIGYLLGTRRYQSCVRSFHKGDHLIVRAVKVYQGNEVGVFNCEIIRDEKILVTAALNVYQPGDRLN